MTDPDPTAWGPTLTAVARSILEQLLAGETDRARTAITACQAAGCQAKTVTSLLSQLGHLGVVDRAERKQLRLTVLGRPWAAAWLEEHPAS